MVDTQQLAPGTEPNDDSVDIADFTLQTRKRIRFRIDNDVFEAHTVMSAPLLQALVGQSEQLGQIVDKKDFEPLYQLFGKILLPESATRFIERMRSTDEDKAIDVVRQVLPIIHYLLEKFGVRPTQPSPGSSAG